MGKILSKRQKYKLQKQNDRLKLENESQNIELKFVRPDIEQLVNDAEVLQRLGGNETNILELYLNDVYEKECVLKACEEEVEFIQTGIETLVQKIVDLVIDDFTYRFNNIETVCDYIDSEELVEAYFNINQRGGFSQVKTARSEIIKVGSFYEGTKNNFPDEFDFIFPLFHVRKGIFFDLLTIWHIIFIIQNLPINLNNKQSLMFISNEQNTVTRKLYFDQYLRVHGPAFKLQFIYINSRGDKRNIHVDLVPADRITPYNMESCLTPYDLESSLEDWTPIPIFPKYLKKEILSTETCLSVGHYSYGIDYSFTETEVHIMRNVLSEKHRKVYRILKFLINGHGDGEMFKLVIGGRHISSYDIKLSMIEHHDKCQNPHTDNISGCVINILELMFQIEKNFYTCNYSPHIPYINKLILSLRIQQATLGAYIYDQVRMKSVPRQCLDDIDRNERGYNLWFRYLDTLGEDDPSMYSFEQFLDAEIPGWRRERNIDLRYKFKPKKKSCLVM